MEYYRSALKKLQHDQMTRGFRWLCLPEGEPQFGDWYQPRLDLLQERDVFRHRLQVRTGQVCLCQGEDQQFQPDRPWLPAEAARR